MFDPSAFGEERPAIKRQYVDDDARPDRDIDGPKSGCHNRSRHRIADISRMKEIRSPLRVFRLCCRLYRMPIGLIIWGCSYVASSSRPSSSVSSSSSSTSSYETWGETSLNWGTVHGGVQNTTIRAARGILDGIVMGRRV